MTLANNNTGLKFQLQTHLSGWGDGHPLRSLLTLYVNLVKSADKSSFVSNRAKLRLTFHHPDTSRSNPPPFLKHHRLAVIETTC